MITKDQVQKAQEQYQTIIRTFLFERGWRYNLNRLDPWSKWVEGRHMQAKDAEEAFVWENEL